MSKMYQTRDLTQIEEILAEFDQNVYSSIEQTVVFIKENTLKFLSGDEKENLIIKHYKIISKLANILSDLLENFVFILFLKNELSSVVLQMLGFYIKLKNRKISRLFFEVINEIKEFIMKVRRAFN